MSGHQGSPTVPSPPPGAQESTPPTNKRRRVWPWVTMGFVTLVLVWVGLLGWDAWKLQGAATDLEAHASAAQEAVRNRDADALSAHVLDVQHAADDFAAHASGPHWAVASWIPWVKDQTVPVQQAGASVGALADGALEPLAQIDDLSVLEVPPIDNGRIDPYVLEPYRETLAGAATTIETELAALDGLDTSRTIGLVADQVTRLTSEMEQVGYLIQGAHVAAELLPAMLGADGERTYAVMVQNNAEPRTSGGIPGAILEMSIDDGLMTLVQYESAAAMATPQDAVAELTEDEQRIFTERMAWYPQDVNFTPEFPRAAELMSAFWEREFGDAPDGVLSVDPVALQYMLAGMEPTDVAGVTITGDNVAQIMLNQVYFEFEDPDQSDAFFALAASTLFGDLLSSQNSALAPGLERAAAEGRLALWSADADEQALLATTGIDGDFMKRDDALGVFLNDGSGSKIGYYIDDEVETVVEQCSNGDVVRASVSIELRHGLDAESSSDLPWYISGGGVYVPESEFHANVLVYPPVGMGIDGVTVDGETATFHPEHHHGRALGASRVVLSPGDSTVVTYELSSTAWGVAVPPTVITPGPTSGMFVTQELVSAPDC
ncbi:DUF4012 domain-containing protein [Demequina sp. B12]|uniref:DUF4012 domain-containing protein n=1 Tax=Demequina sp. B12 TaxID=2992757 RepID=UPI00237B3A9A|nr:DUF4012 domain-containing protein [Demequina sp. B12]MDE0573643.1 DUF4012 domain-containing protein [Demequina sp. B12]